MFLSIYFFYDAIYSVEDWHKIRNLLLEVIVIIWLPKFRIKNKTYLF